MPTPCGKTDRTDDALVVETIDVATLVHRLAEGGLLLDVRRQTTRDEVGIIPTALLADRTSIDEDFGFSSDQRLPEVMGPDQQIVVYCSSEAGSLPVASRLRALGFARVAQLGGGFPAWVAAGQPVASGSSAP